MLRIVNIKGFTMIRINKKKRKLPNSLIKNNTLRSN